MTVNQENEEAEENGISGLRSLITPQLPPGIFNGCVPPVPFPGNCKPARNEPYVVECPINIPYCLR